jgi:opacity protein-like surface antigen
MKKLLTTAAVLAALTAQATGETVVSPLTQGLSPLGELYAWTYDELARRPNAYAGWTLTFSGKVVQVMQEEEGVDLRIAISEKERTALGRAHPSHDIM